MSIVEAGGFSVLSQLLEKERNPKLFENYLAAMRNLSDAELKFVSHMAKRRECNDSLVKQNSAHCCRTTLSFIKYPYSLIPM